MKYLKIVTLCNILLIMGMLLLSPEIIQAAEAGLAKNSRDSIAPDKKGMRELTPIELAAEMKVGWNLGNTLEAIGGETAWGNPKTNQRLIDSVKAAGFNAVRIPVAWSVFSDSSNYLIKAEWMARVEEVVNYVLKNDMYAIINIHWDGGWMQPTYARQKYVNNRFAIMWKQIAVHFRDYNDHLLFAGTNEVMRDGDYGTPTEEYYTVQNGFNELFVKTVRSTGGRNTYRHLVIQGFNTNIDHCVNFLKIPADPTPQRLMIEVHYYDPYNFTLNEQSNVIQWGKNATDPSKTETWANEEWADNQFLKMKTTYVDKGYAVLVGEYAAARRSFGNNTMNKAHQEYRNYWVYYVTRSMAKNGLIPFYWDTGFLSGLFVRATGKQYSPELIRTIMKAVEEGK